MFGFLRPKRETHLIRDAVVILVSIGSAILLERTGFIESFVTRSSGLEIIGAFVAGVFFTSLISVAPAAVALAEISKNSSILLTAVFGGLGSMVGDYIMFRFVRDQVSDDLSYLFQMTPGSKRLRHIFRKRLFRWMLPFLGALVIASPLPDEIGITLLGLSKMKSRYFLLISLVFNFTGIFILGLLVR
jgi:hypothetical protein